MSRIKTTFTLDEQIVNELETFAHGLSKKKSHIIETALTLYFDMMDVKLAKKILQDIKDNKEELFTEEEALKELGLN